MNKKYLAVALAAVAIIGVVYLVYVMSLREPTQRLDQPGQPENPTTESAPGKTGSESGGPIIDYDSEVLLKPIDSSWIVPYPQKELPWEFGTLVFSSGKPGKSVPAGNQKPKHQERTSRGRQNPRGYSRS